YGAKGVVAAIGVASRALAEILQNGVTQSELDRARTDMKSIFEAASAGARTTPSPTLANLLLKAVDDGSAFVTPEQTAALYNDEIKDISVGEVSAALRDAFSGAGPFVLVSGYEAPAGGAQAVAKALATAPIVKASSDA